MKNGGRWGARLRAPVGRALRALGVTIPRSLTGSALLGLGMLVVYIRMLTAWPGQGLVGWDLEALVTHGALWPPSVTEGQWWRLGTMAFVHIGVVHVVFNGAALSQAGPLAEEIYGSGRMVLAFMLTAIAAAAASAWLQPLTPTAGASGGLMGLIGMLAGWGHRDGTTIGRGVRDRMAKWAAYTMIFGLAIEANHVAHAAGFGAGAALGLATDRRWVERTRGSAGSSLLGGLAAVAAVACTWLALVPPRAARELGASLGPTALATAEIDRAYVAEVDRACAELGAGRDASAVAISAPPRATIPRSRTS